MDLKVETEYEPLFSFLPFIKIPIETVKVRFSESAPRDENTLRECLIEFMEHFGYNKDELQKMSLNDLVDLTASKLLKK